MKTRKVKLNERTDELFSLVCVAKKSNPDETIENLMQKFIIINKDYIDHVLTENELKQYG